MGTGSEDEGDLARDRHRPQGRKVARAGYLADVGCGRPDLLASERDGHFNIWRIPAAGGRPVQVTTHKKDGVQFASISPDGKTVAYENEFELWTLDVPGGSPRKVTIDLEFDPKENLVDFLPSKNKADAFDPAPDGEAVAIEFHGEIVLVPSDPETGEKRQVTSSAWRDRRPLFSPDGRYVTYISDETKEQEFWLFDCQTGARP